MARITLGDRLKTLSEDSNLAPRDRAFAASLLKSYQKSNTLTVGRRPWVEILERRAAEAANAPTIEVPAEFVTLQEKIHATSGESCWAAGFIESVIAQVKRGKSLSARQQEVLDGMREEYNGSWADDYKADFRERALLIAAYYKRARLPYWSNVVEGILGDESYVPPKKSFMKMWGNKYAQRVVEQSLTAPVFTPRDTVQVRSNYTTRSKYSRYVGKKGFIMADAGIIEAVKGGRGYTVLFAGDPKPLVIEERYLMKAKKAKK